MNKTNTTGSNATAVIYNDPVDLMSIIVDDDEVVDDEE